MAHNPHFVDPHVDRLKTTRRRAIHAFMRDGHLDDLERQIVHEIDETLAGLATGRAWDAAGDYIKRSGGRITAYGRDRFRAIGYELVPIRDEPAANVVAFPSNDANAG